MNPQVDKYLKTSKKWQKELEMLRNLILDCGLTEQFKWRNPCYQFEKKNILIIGGFKEYCTIGFFKGALLQNKHGLLIQQTENSQSVRQLRFTSISEIEALSTTIKAIIIEAIEVEKAGLQVPQKTTKDFGLPEELEFFFNSDPAFENAFKSLTPGRQRGYLLYFSQPKQAKTKTARIEKYRSRIFNGKGINDCVCGLSKRMPGCDGSHKQLE